MVSFTFPHRLLYDGTSAGGDAEVVIQDLLCFVLDNAG